MRLDQRRRGERIAPLQHLTLLDSEPGTITVTDGRGAVYATLTVEHAGQAVSFTTGGAAGHHHARHTAVGSAEPDGTVEFVVQAVTSISDDTAHWGTLLERLRHSLLYEFGAYQSVMHAGRSYSYFVCWLRDHVHALKGMRYFTGDRIEQAIDLYRDTQRDDGMIWDNVYPRELPPNAWQARFTAGGFIRPLDDDEFWELKRIPVEADVEYLFVEGVYRTWKTIGDDAWLAATVDAAVAALDYSFSDRYRWSEKFGLIKRGYTIDTWDFQPTGWGTDSGLMPDDPMVVDPDTSRFGVMHGDNTGYQASCRYLAEMLDQLGRTGEAKALRERADEISRRLTDLAWNGRFFRHHVLESADHVRDFGVDEELQLSLSNAYALNRGITHAQAVAIIDTYRELRDDLPEGSPGEWYSIYPPFERGFDRHLDVWQYVNGGVLPVVAGELARGALRHGREQYGVDILTRLAELGTEHGQFHASYTGADLPPADRSFTTIDLLAQANTDLRNEPELAAGRDAGVAAWPGAPGNDLRQFPGSGEYAGVPFAVLDPSSNGGRGCIGLSHEGEYADEVTVVVQARAASLYFLHTVADVGDGSAAGHITITYADGSTHRTAVVQGRNVAGLWGTVDPHTDLARAPSTAVGWRGANDVYHHVGLVVFGLDNPHPDRVIDALTFTAAPTGGFWAVVGVTTSDGPVYFPANPISTGLPVSWGTGSVVAALIEGLAGIVDGDDSTGLAEPVISPRWAATGTTTTDVVVAYPATGHYVAYWWHHTPAESRIDVEVTGSGTAATLRILLPPHARSAMVISDGNGEVACPVEVIEDQTYAIAELDTLAPTVVSFTYSATEPA